MANDTARNAKKRGESEIGTRSTPSVERVIVFAGEYLQIDQEFFDFLHGVYGEGLMDQFRSMEAWLRVNPRRRKKNNRRFVVNWLNKEAREFSRHLKREIETDKELRAGAGPVGYWCEKCGRRLVAAFLPATCPRCGAQRSFLKE